MPDLKGLKVFLKTLLVLAVVWVGVSLWSSGTLHSWTLRLVEAQIEMYGIILEAVEIQ